MTEINKQELIQARDEKERRLEQWLIHEDSRIQVYRDKISNLEAEVAGIIANKDAVERASRCEIAKLDAQIQDSPVFTPCQRVDITKENEMKNLQKFKELKEQLADVAERTKNLEGTRDWAINQLQVIKSKEAELRKKMLELLKTPDMMMEVINAFDLASTTTPPKPQSKLLDKVAAGHEAAVQKTSRTKTTEADSTPKVENFNLVTASAVVTPVDETCRTKIKVLSQTERILQILNAEGRGLTAKEIFCRMKPTSAVYSSVRTLTSKMWRTGLIKKTGNIRGGLFFTTLKNGAQPVTNPPPTTKQKRTMRPKVERPTPQPKAPAMQQRILTILENGPAKIQDLLQNPDLKDFKESSIRVSVYALRRHGKVTADEEGVLKLSVTPAYNSEPGKSVTVKSKILTYFSMLEPNQVVTIDTVSKVTGIKKTSASAYLSMLTSSKEICRPMKGYYCQKIS